MLSLSDVATGLSQNAETIQSLVHHVAKEQAVWKPDPAQWSILEVINHLTDEEREDFRTRFDLIIYQPTAQWPNIDPQIWAIERSYNTRDLAESLEMFLLERDKTITWLKGLASPDLDQAHARPSFGNMRVGDLLASWLAHDLLHIRQLTRLHYQWLQTKVKPYAVTYAGKW
jgi:DinB superfamily